MNSIILSVIPAIIPCVIALRESATALTEVFFFLNTPNPTKRPKQPLNVPSHLQKKTWTMDEGSGLCR